ncbi:MAG: hypothetical protein CFE37_09125 [Alphaproteobacteria bacterium PA4]|nr:MAG: hypothetical protein CFE37_09125 [Alphaproteobacteria bacterium PA4]
MATIVRVPARFSLRTAKMLSIVAPFGLVLSMIGGAYFLGDAGRVLPLFHALRLIFGLTCLALFIDGRTQATNVPERFDPLFDERERAERDRAFRNSHKLITGSIFALCAWVTVARGWGLWLPDVRGAVDIAIGLAFIAMGLPAIILIWRERPVSDDE